MSDQVTDRDTPGLDLAGLEAEAVRVFDPEPQCAAEATETGLVGDRVSGRLGDPALAGAQAGRERSRLVAYGREPAGEQSHEQPVVQRAGACKSLREVSGATTLRRTAGYGPVCPVVWGDGGREPPSYPMGVPGMPRVWSESL